MKARVIFISCASVTIEIENSDAYYNKFNYDVKLDGTLIYENINTNVFSIYNLEANKKYHIEFNKTIDDLFFETLPVSYITNVKDFGAVGDGIHDDTLSIITAIQATPKQGMVVIPRGDYLIRSIFLKDDITLNLVKGSRLIADTDRHNYPYFPDVISYHNQEQVIGTWEGNPSRIFTSPLTIINNSNVKVIGEGTIDGNANLSDWWVDVRTKRIAFRPRGVFIAHSNNVYLQGVTITNTASWALHPFFSNNLKLIDLKINNPNDSPNTDGCNPESCSDVEIIGIYFSVGDDCISLKSGKIYMAKHHYQPSKRIMVRNCYMHHGHGALVIGSEMSSGVEDVIVQQCIFEGTDRGLRIKTRRGRGNKANIDNVTFNNILMKEVLNPFVINMYYFCDPDGKSLYVSSKDPFPVDERTPHLGTFYFQNIKCEDTLISGGFFYGLAEAPIEKISLENVSIDYKENDEYQYPAMMEGIEKVNRLGLYFNYVNAVELKNVTLTNYVGDKYIFKNVKKVRE